MVLKRKKYIKGSNVYQTSLERIRYLFDKFDKIVVSFSGGKDSTVILNLSLQIAKEKNKLPLKVIFFDEECIHPTTIEYVERIRQNPEIDFTWYCLELKHRNACSTHSPYWYCWDKSKKNLWARELPENIVTEHKDFKKGMSVPDFSPYCFDKNEGNVCIITGIRAQESMRRLRLVLKRKRENYINQSPERGFVYKAHPIFDWRTEDVWIAPNKFKWDYNKTYDIFEKYGIPISQQRVCPPFGEEPLRGLYTYASCFPDLWEKMVARVPGVGSAYRYANTELYSMPKNLPENMNWEQYTKMVLERYPAYYRKIIKESVNEAISLHYKKSTMPVSQNEPDLISGISWRFLCKVVIRGDLKGRTLGLMQIQAENNLKKKKMTLKEAIEKNGTQYIKDEYYGKSKN